MKKEPKMISCKRCGTESIYGTKKCPSCGKRLKKPFYKRVWFWILIIFILLIVLASASGNSGSDQTADTTVIESETTHLYDNAEIRDVMNGTGTDKIGEYSVCFANKADCTEEALTDYYFNYVAKNEDLKWFVILFNDVDDLEGVYTNASLMEVGALFEEEDGEYSLSGDLPDATYYIADTDSQTLILQVYDEEPVAEESATDETADETTDETAVDLSDATTGEKNALDKAYSYLSYTAFSYSGLIDQLEYEGFTTEEATFGADNCGADWNEQALQKAKDYLDYTAFSYTGLIDQLEFEGFTTEEATFGADNCDADWNEQAALKAADYLDYSSFSREGLIDQLEFEGFTSEQAEYGVSQVYD